MRPSFVLLFKAPPALSSFIWPFLMPKCGRQLSFCKQLNDHLFLEPHEIPKICLRNNIFKKKPEVMLSKIPDVMWSNHYGIGRA